MAPTINAWPDYGRSRSRPGRLLPLCWPIQSGALGPVDWPKRGGFYEPPLRRSESGAARSELWSNAFIVRDCLWRLRPS